MSDHAAVAELIAVMEEFLHGLEEWLELDDHTPTAATLMLIYRAKRVVARAKKADVSTQRGSFL